MKRISVEVKNMPQSKKRPKPTAIEKEIRSYDPTKSKFGKIILLILAVGMFLGLVIAAIYGAISVLG
jgi:hypothetical protein